jgi:hypothetical protein
MSDTVLDLFPGHIEVVSCGECGIRFGLPARFIEARRADGRNFHCPNGHLRCYRETEADRLKKTIAWRDRELKFANERIEGLQRREKALDYSRRAIKGQLTKVRAHVGNGVCPCCHRSFENLRRHMSTKHPEFKNTPKDDVGGAP